MQPPVIEITFPTLELRFSQLLKISDRSRSSKFSDPNKEDFHDTLLRIIDKMSKEDFSKFDRERLIKTYYIIEKVFGWFEYLVNSTINQTPYEIISSLEEVLSDWLDNRKSYLLLTSLSNKRDHFAFDYDDKPLILSKIKKNIEELYGETIKFDVIRIVLPKFLSHDYLTAVSLYHEIGHFVDWRFQITETILFKLGLPLKPDNIVYYREHFADLFAAQYVDMASCSHVNYLTYEKFVGNYPPTPERISLVSKFLAGKRIEILKIIKNVCKECTGTDLKVRYKSVTKTDFNSLIPAEIHSSAQLHGLFVTAWEIWLDPKSKLRRRFNKKHELYRILNNLVEKSMSNYFITKSWALKNVSDQKIY